MAKTNDLNPKVCVISAADLKRVPKLIADIESMARCFNNLPWPEGLSTTFRNERVATTSRRMSGVANALLKAVGVAKRKAEKFAERKIKEDAKQDALRDKLAKSQAKSRLLEELINRQLS